MRIIFLIIIIYLFIVNKATSETIKIINLHNDSADEPLLNSDEDITITENEDLQDVIDNGNELDENIEDIENENEINQTELIEIEDKENENQNNNDEIKALPDFWEIANKDDLLFLFENIKPIKSKTLNQFLINSFAIKSLPPKDFTEDEFKFIQINNLVKFGHREKVLNIINEFTDNSDYYDFINFFKLNYYFSIYDLNKACEFNKDLDRQETKIDPNFILKVDIFCSFLENKIEEADFLNSLLQEATDQDKFFQEIYMNLKNSKKNAVNIDLKEFNKNIMPLYSSMLRVGDMPLSQKFLEYDPTNLAIPIILSGSSDISLRLKAAHTAYSEGSFNAESLAALYQTVDFNFDELNDQNKAKEKINNIIEIEMAYLYQKANIQILPITRIEALIDFWNFSSVNNLNLLSYDISRNLIDAIEPSPELAEYGVQIAKAHIYNNNFELAEKWILFSENYNNNEINNNIESLKLLFNLKKSNEDEEFNNILLNSSIFDQNLENKINQEILLTIWSVINDDLEKTLNENRTLIESRSMPSRYLLNTIKNSSNNNNFGEMILSIAISVEDKQWKEIHPEHLRIILLALSEANLEDVFRKIIFEILEESKII